MKIQRIIDSIINTVYNYIMIKRQNVILGNYNVINGRLRVCSSGKIIIGDHFRVNSGSNFNVIGGDVKTNFIVYSNGLLEIKNNVGISNTTIVVSEKVQIGNNVRIGGSCKIYDTDFHSIFLNDRISKDDKSVKTAPVIIKDGAFIGAHCIILKGTVIGRNSVIGAGSVVSGHIPDNEIWAGNPVRFIRHII